MPASQSFSGKGETGRTSIQTRLPVPYRRAIPLPLPFGSGAARAARSFHAGHRMTESTGRLWQLTQLSGKPVT